MVNDFRRLVGTRQSIRSPLKMEIIDLYMITMILIHTNTRIYKTIGLEVLLDFHPR